MIYTEADLKTLVQKIKAPYKSAYISTLGGAENNSILLAISLDHRESWKYHIMENSRYIKLYLDKNLALSTISGSIPKLRKKTFTDLNKASLYINNHINKIKKETLWNSILKSQNRKYQ